MKETEDVSSGEVPNTQSDVESSVMSSPTKSSNFRVTKSIKITEEEIEYRKSAYPDLSVVEDARLMCTVCMDDVKNCIPNLKVYYHKHLYVLLCKKCADFYGSGEFSMDEDGLDKYCRWCGQGGQLYICSKCPTAFCKSCIKRNINRKLLGEIEDDDWKCYICSPTPLYKLRALCWAVEQYIGQMKKSLETKKKVVSKNSGDSNDKSNIFGDGFDWPDPALMDNKKICKQIKIVRNWLHSTGGDLKQFSTNLSCKVEKLVEADMKGPKDVEKYVTNLTSVLDASVKMLSNMKGTIIEYVTQWKDLFDEAVRKELEESASTLPSESNSLKEKQDSSGPPDIGVDQDNRNGVDSSSDDVVIIKDSPEIVADSDSLKITEGADNSTEQCEQAKDDDGNKSTEVKPLLRVRNVEELNRVMCGEEKVIGESDSVEDESAIKSGPKLPEDADKKQAEDTTEVMVNGDEVNRSINGDSAKEGKQACVAVKSESAHDDEDKGKVTLTVDSDSEGEEAAQKDCGKNRSSMKEKVMILLSNSSQSTGSFSDGSNTDKELETKRRKKLSLSSSRKRKKNGEEKWKAKRSVLELSSSEDEIDKLLNMKGLEKKKVKLQSDLSSGSTDEKDSAAPEQDSKKRKPKEKQDELTVADCLASDDNKSPGEHNSSASSLDITSEIQKLSSISKDPVFDISRDIFDITPENSGLSSPDNDLVLEEKKNENKEKKSKPTKEKESSDESGSSNKKDQSKWRRDKLLTEKLTDTDSDEKEEKWRKRKEQVAAKEDDDAESSSSSFDVIKKSSKMRKKRSIKRLNIKSSSDSDVDSETPQEASVPSSESSESEPVQKKKRRRIQKASSDSDTDNEKKIPDSGGKGRKNIRKVLKEDNLKQSTQAALKEEEERKKRIAERQKLYNQMMQIEQKMAETLEKLVLDFDPETKKELVSVDKDLVKKMKPHQAEGIKFMWDSCYESLKDAKKTKGSGCILAHCMGLGKSFQVVTLVHTLLTHPELNVNTVLVVCPLSTVLNWVNEFDKWLKDVGSGKDIEVYHMTKTPASHRHYQLKDWSRNGGVFVVGYNMYRSLTNPKARYKQAAKKIFQETLVDPGPDLVICDEGHILKNESTALSSSMSRIKTQRRIVLTGTPLQNNLVEYHCMVQFVKPNLLGTKKEFKNRFVNPIQNGQFEDSTAHDVKVMKRRAHVLHKMLDGVVQRKDYNVLTPFLPTKFEYVISLSLSEVQCKLYQHYLDNLSQGKNQPEGGRKATTLFKDWQVLTSLCAHPRVLLMHQEREILNSKELSDESEGSLKDFIDDDDDDDGDKSSSSDSSGSGSESGSEKATNNRQTKRSTRANPTLEDESEPETPTIKEWWSDLVTEEQLEDVRMSPKIALLLSILKKCEDIGDKLLVFSQSLLALNLIEYFLERIDEATQSGEVKESLGGHCSSWTKGLDYFRLDGKTASENRTSFVNMFNQPDNTRARLFLISTKAGGLGINLIGANRVILFDASWNPSFDVQSIFRIYRFGQKKPCYIYRFLAQGTIEERVYERQVAKLSISCRVVDEQQVDRHFSHSDLTELYTFKPQPPGTNETPILPKDRLMAELLQEYKDLICSYHHHDSLLENQEEEELNEEERQAAWTDFENEKNAPPPSQNYFLQNDLLYQNMLATITARLAHRYPDWTPEQVANSANMALAQSRINMQQQQQQQRIINMQHMLQQQQQQQQLQQNLQQVRPMKGARPMYGPHFGMLQQQAQKNMLQQQAQMNMLQQQMAFANSNRSDVNNQMLSQLLNTVTIDPVIHNVDE